MNRYTRHIILPEIGEAGQAKLSQSSILIVGAGGLGCPVLQYLTAAGVGTLGIIDFDTVEESNLQRQVLFGSSSLGKNKAIAARERLQDLNPTIHFNVYPERLAYENALMLFNDYDIIVDSTDSFASRYIINDASLITRKPLVYGAIYKFEGQLSVFNYKNGPSYRCLFPAPPQEGAIPNCSEIGVLGVLPGIIGTMQANEALKILLGIGAVLSGKVLYYNALTLQTTTLSIQRSEHASHGLSIKEDYFQNAQSAFNSGIASAEISIAGALQKRNAQFIDVREYGESSVIKGLNCIHIPIGELEESLGKIALDKDKIVFCESGIRSRHAVSILHRNHITNSYYLKEGAAVVQKQLCRSNSI